MGSNSAAIGYNAIASTDNVIVLGSSVTTISVGVNTPIPAATLDVNGTAQFGSGASKSTFTATGNLVLANAASVSGAGTFDAMTLTGPVVSSNSIMMSTMSASINGSGGSTGGICVSTLTITLPTAAAVDVMFTGSIDCGGTGNTVADGFLVDGAWSGPYSATKPAMVVYEFGTGGAPGNLSFDLQTGQLSTGAHSICFTYWSPGGCAPRIGNSQATASPNQFKLRVVP